MADEDKKLEASPDTTRKEEAKPAQEESKESAEWQQLVGDKFKNETELAKAYKELEAEQGRKSEEVHQAREFVQQVQPLLNEIQNDPEIFNKLDKKLRDKNQPNQTTDSSANSATADAQGEMRTAQSDLILARFEEKHGIDKLDPEARRISRQKVGDVIYEMTGKNLSGIDLRRLSPVLENAYLISNNDENMKKSKLEGQVSAASTEEAVIPGVPSSDGKTEKTITSAEAKVADRLGLTREQYISGKK